MWVFGDLNKPLLGDVSLGILAHALVEERAQLISVLSKPNRKANSKSKASDLYLKREEALLESFKIFKQAKDRKPDSINLRGFTVENLSFAGKIKLVELPWSVDAWTTFQELDFDENSYIIEIDGLNWFEVLEAGDWVVLFEILHNIFDWAPFANTRGLFVPQTRDLGEFAVFLERMLQARSGNAIFLLEDWGSFLSRRFGWGCESITLEKFGAEIGVTRERVRQIEQSFLIQFQGVNFVAPVALDDFDQLTNLARTSEDLDDFDGPDNTPNHWGVDAIAGAVRLYMGNWAYANFLDLLRAKEATASESFRTASKLKKLRSKLGIIRVSDIRQFLVDNDIPLQNMHSTILSVYPRSLFSKDFVLARTNKNEPLLYNATIRQLAISQPLHYEVLFRGVEQAARYRSVASDLPGPITYKDLLSEHENISVDEDGLVSYMGDHIEVEVDSIRQWLVNELLNSDGNLSSKASLLREAARSGLKFNSVSMYLAYSPEFRAIGDSLYTLVGAEPSAGQISDVKAISSINRVLGSESGFQLYPNGEFSVSYIFGTDFLTSGVLSVSTRIGQLIGSGTRAAECCPTYTSESKPKLSGKTFLSNMAGIRDHLWFDHGLREGSRFNLSFSRDFLTVTLGR